MDSFSHKWLNLWCWGVGAFGLLLAGYAFAPTEGFTRLFFDLLGQPIPDDPGQHLRFAMGLRGCITIGWAITFAAAFKGAAHLTGPAAQGVWRTLALAVIVWFVIDSGVSIATGFWRNAVSNTVLVLLYFVPVLRSGVLAPK